MSNLGISVTGFPELKAKIQELANDKDKKKEVLLILRQVARPVLQATKNAVPVSSKSHIARGKKIQSGNLKKSLGLITSKSSNPMILVGPRAKNGNDGWYGHMVHGGHAIYHNSQNSRKVLKSGRKKSVLARVTNKRKGNAVGRVEGIPFMDIAYEQTKSGATADAQDKLAKFIQRRINKLSN
jgi:hypothetical protein